MKEPLSSFEQAVFNFLMSYQHDNGFTPTLQEILNNESFKFKSRTNGRYWLGQLEDKGYIVREPKGQKRNIKLILGEKK